MNINLLEDYKSLDNKYLPDLFHHGNNNYLSYLPHSIMELHSFSVKSSFVLLYETLVSHSIKIDD